MRRPIPSTAALAAFEAAARHQSFTKAAAELHVTQGAICRQIAALEAMLGVKLFRRTSRGVTLTDAGAAYGPKVAMRLEDMERDTLDLMSSGGTGAVLELGVVPTFATRWLVPRLPDFIARHPGISVNLSARARPFLFDDTPFDAAISAGESPWPGTVGADLMHEQLVPVCSPAYFAARRSASLREIDWTASTLLQQGTRPHAWRQWFQSSTLHVDGDMVGPRFELFSMQIAAAMHGMGVALVPRLMVDDELARGLLRLASTHLAPSERVYRLICPEQKADNQGLARFRDWLVDAASRYAAQAGARR
jgi:LysR family glycine cleavage system transcriptional activator